MGEAVSESCASQDAWVVQLDSEALVAAIAAWVGSPEAQQDHHRNRQLLAQIAIQLMREFRAEEDRLFRMNSPLLPGRRNENHRLASQL
jgi:hypothetical protein